MSRVKETLLDSPPATKPKKLSQMKRDVLDIVRFAHGRGVVNMTATEIQRIYEKQPGKTGSARGRVADGYFAGRVSEMVRDGWLLRSSKRQCLEKRGRDDVNTVRAPAGAQEARAPAAPATSTD
jgi:hypothetical protein